MRQVQHQLRKHRIEQLVQVVVVMVLEDEVEILRLGPQFGMLRGDEMDRVLDQGIRDPWE